MNRHKWKPVSYLLSNFEPIWDKSLIYLKLPVEIVNQIVLKLEAINNILNIINIYE
jgi:hypothetical protein